MECDCREGERLLLLVDLPAELLCEIGRFLDPASSSIFRETCKMLYGLISSLMWHHKVTTSAVKFGHLRIVKELVVRLRYRSMITTRMLHVAIKARQIEIVDYLLSILPEIVWINERSLTSDAAASGSLPLLRLLHAKGIPIHPRCAECAARSGNLALLEFLVDQGQLVTDRVLTAAAEFNHKHVIDAVQTRCASKTVNPVFIAIKCGHGTLARHLISTFGFPVASSCLLAAVRSGQRSLYYYLLATGCEAPPPSKLIEEAAGGGQLAMLRYFVDELGHPLSTPAWHAACASGDVDVVQYFLDKKYDAPFVNVGGVPALEGRLNLLRLLNEHGHLERAALPILCSLAALGGRYETFMFLHQLYCRYERRFAVNAAESGCIEIIKFLHEQHGKIDAKACFVAALHNGQLHVIRAMRELGLEWEPIPVDDVASSGNLSALLLAYELGCKWSESATVNALRGDAPHCFLFLIEHGCPFPEAGEIEGLTDECSSAMQCFVKDLLRDRLL